MAKPRNDRNHAVTKFCLSMEEHRRTEIGRVRTAREFVAAFFPYDEGRATDKLFHLMPPEVRGPILSTWGIRGGKAALKDSDEKVRDVVHDALVAGDIDETVFEEGMTAETLVDWVALSDWWSFWRQGKLTGAAIQKALATARELELIDDLWFLANLQSRGGKLKGTDVVCDTLSKDQVVAWMRRLHEAGDGSPAGLIAAVGWETVLVKTAQEALLFALDAFAKKASLIAEAPPSTKKEEGLPPSAQVIAVATRIDEPPVLASEGPTLAEKHDSGIPIAIPDIPAIDSAIEDSSEHVALDPSALTDQDGNIWGPVGESPKLIEARAKMMEMLGAPPSSNGSSEAWAPSDVPEKPSSLEWGEPDAGPPGGGPPGARDRRARKGARGPAASLSLDELKR